jgi:hypothetical protein
MASAKMRAASWGAWKPVEFPALMKSTRNWARRWSFSAAAVAGPHLVNIAFREQRRARLAEDGSRAL